MKKKTLTAILCICVIVSVFGEPVAQAVGLGSAEVPIQQSRWTNTSVILLDMKLSSGTVTSEGVVVGKAGTTRIAVTFILEKLVNGNYSYVDSWSASDDSIQLRSTRYTSGCTSGTYKLSISGTVTKDGYNEYISDWFTKTL